MRSPGFEPGSSAWQASAHSIDWKQFEKWLLRDHKRHVVVSLVSYGKQFSKCLIQRDLGDVRDLRDTLRPNVMKALSALAKFLGIYQEYKQLIKNYGLKWTGRSSDDLIIDRLTKVTDSNEVFEWIRQVKATRPELTDFMNLVSMTGLRFGEAIESYNLIIKLAKEGKLSNYYNEEKRILEHFRFKEIFIRNSKKAFISFIPKASVQNISRNKPLTPNSIQSKVRKRKLRLRFSDVREAHATFMTKFLSQPEIDFLHGRVSTNVFMRNYFNPALIGDLETRIFMGIKDMQTKI